MQFVSLRWFDCFDSFNKGRWVLDDCYKFQLRALPLHPFELSFRKALKYPLESIFKLFSTRHSFPGKLTLSDLLPIDGAIN